MDGSQWVVVDSLDGFQFEELCAEIYRQLGYEVQNVRDVADEGRDLVLRSPDGEPIVAECKHWPGRPVGRPVIQKLHSAVMTLPAKRGMLLTTGYFPRSSREYVEKLNEPIELIDFARLKDLAAKAGITLASTKDPIPILRVVALDFAALKGHLNDWIFNRFTSAPLPADSLLLVVEHSTSLRPTYLVHYSLKQDFSTSIGRIHKLDIPDGVLFLDGEDGNMLDPGVATLMKGTAMLPFAERQSPVAPVPQGTFKLGATEAREAAGKYIERIHRTSVSYWGRNNQQYTLDCVPSRKNTFFKDIKQVYLPEHTLEIRAMRRQYHLEFIENGQVLHWLKPPDLFKCRICARRFGQGVLCNSCGSVSCVPGPFWWDFYPAWLRSIFSRLFLYHARPHSLRCTLCSRTICMQCASWLTRWHLFKSPVCQEPHAL